MEIDHIIIFTNNQGREADELVQFGLLEGSNRVHPGQGTRNRKFYFQNFFLEIVWVFNEDEIRSKITAPTHLWERCQNRGNRCSPYGLVLVDTDDTNILFEKSIKYRPDYLDPDSSFDIITNHNHPHLPWACRFATSRTHISQEPKDHHHGIRELTGVQFGINSKDYHNTFTQLISHKSIIQFHYASYANLTLEFDRGRNGLIQEFREIPLSIKY